VLLLAPETLPAAKRMVAPDGFEPPTKGL
jgi:hypothetical protein